MKINDIINEDWFDHYQKARKTFPGIDNNLRHGGWDPSSREDITQMLKQNPEYVNSHNSFFKTFANTPDFLAKAFAKVAGYSSDQIDKGLDIRAALRKEYPKAWKQASNGDLSAALKTMGVTEQHLREMYQDFLNEAAPRLGDDPFKDRDSHADWAFIGPNSKVWNKSANKLANDMEKAGYNPRDIWSQTGNWRGVDGAWRQEIDDSQMNFKVSPSSLKPGENIKLGDMIDHPALFKAYPELRDVSVNVEAGSEFGGELRALKTDIPVIDKLLGGTGGAKMTLKPDGYYGRASDDEVVSHEIQHAIDAVEPDFKVGPSPSYLANPVADKLGTYTDQVYRGSAGEVGAYVTGDERRNMSAQQRRQVYPGDSVQRQVNRDSGGKVYVPGKKPPKGQEGARSNSAFIPQGMRSYTGYEYQTAPPSTGKPPKVVPASQVGVPKEIKPNTISKPVSNNKQRFK